MPFLRARLVALFLLSTGAVYGAYLGWDPAQLLRPGPLAWPPVAMGLAVLGGAALQDRLFATAERVGRGRLRLVGGVGHGGVLFLTLLGILAGEPSPVASGIVLMMLLQPLLLLLAGLGRGFLGVLLNSLALTMVASLGGGVRASTAVTAHAGLLVFFLAADHAARKLSDYPVETVPPPGPVLGQALVPGVLATGLLSGLFALVPPAPYTPLKRAGATQPLPSGELASILLELGVILGMAGLVFYLVLRFATGRGRAEGEAVAEKVLARAASESAPLPRPPEGVVEDGSWRAKIIRLYVRLTRQLGGLGVRRRPDQTPREYARKLAPEPAAGELTEVFMRARYGDRDLAEAEFKAAQAASQAILNRLRGRS
jgi:hypothetical protein